MTEEQFKSIKSKSIFKEILGSEPASSSMNFSETSFNKLKGVGVKY